MVSPTTPTSDDNNILHDGQYYDPFVSLKEYYNRAALLQQIRGCPESSIHILGLELLEDEDGHIAVSEDSDSGNSFANDSIKLKDIKKKRISQASKTTTKEISW